MLRGTAAGAEIAMAAEEGESHDRVREAHPGQWEQHVQSLSRNTLGRFEKSKEVGVIGTQGAS